MLKPPPFCNPSIQLIPIDVTPLDFPPDITQSPKGILPAGSHPGQFPGKFAAQHFGEFLSPQLHSVFRSLFPPSFQEFYKLIPCHSVVCYVKPVHKAACISACRSKSLILSSSFINKSSFSCQRPEDVLYFLRYLVVLSRGVMGRSLLLSEAAQFLCFLSASQKSRRANAVGDQHLYRGFLK